MQAIEQQAHQAAQKVVPAADKASEQIEGTAKQLATNAEPAADKLSQAAVQAAQRASETAVPTGYKAAQVLRSGAKDASHNPDEYGKRVRQTFDTCSPAAAVFGSGQCRRGCWSCAGHGCEGGFVLVCEFEGISSSK